MTLTQKEQTHRYREKTSGYQWGEGRWGAIQGWGTKRYKLLGIRQKIYDTTWGMQQHFTITIKTVTFKHCESLYYTPVTYILGKNTGVSCHFLPQGIFPTQGSNPGFLHCRHILYHLSYQRSPLYSNYTSIKNKFKKKRKKKWLELGLILSEFPGSQGDQTSQS